MTSVASDTESPRILRRVILGSVIGNGLEWFDFVSYGYFAGAISTTFFPGRYHLVLTWATFAIGFVVRPVGGVLLGAYADRYGRKNSLALLIVMMAFGTLTLGVTPSYGAIGIAAPLIIVLGRIVQGISIGGEYGNSTALLVEYAPPGRRMLFGSFQMSSQALGRVIAAGCALLVLTALPASALHHGAWRIPFILGALVGPFGFWVRYRLKESPEFRAMKDHTAIERAPIVEVVRHYWLPLICAIGLTIIGTALTYIWNTYLPIYVVKELHLPLWEDLVGIMVTSGIDIVVCAIGGMLADRFGAYRMFFLFTAISALISYPFFAFVLAAPGFERLIIAQLVVLTVMGLLQGSGPGLYASMFPAAVRSTGMAISYNLSVMIFGGFSPLTITWLIAMTGNALMPAYYIVAAGIASLVIVGSTVGRVKRLVPATA